MTTDEDDISLCIHPEKSKNTTRSWTWWFCSQSWIIHSFRTIVMQFQSLFQSLFSTVILFNEVKNSFVPVCPTVVPLSLPKPVLHRQRISYFSFNFQNPLVSLRSSSSCLRLIPRVHIASNLLSTYVSVTCFKKTVTTQEVTNLAILLSFYCM